MLPNGIMGIIAENPLIVTRFVTAHRERCSESQHVRIETLTSGTVALGSVTSAASEAVLHFSRSDDDTGIGVFDGIAFDDWAVETEPHRLLTLSVNEIDAGANGMFLAAAADGRNLRIVTDPWGSLPLYVARGESWFAFSCSLRALQRLTNTDISILNLGGGKPTPDLRNNLRRPDRVPWDRTAGSCGRLYCAREQGWIFHQE